MRPVQQLPLLHRLSDTTLVGHEHIAARPTLQRLQLRCTGQTMAVKDGGRAGLASVSQTSVFCWRHVQGRGIRGRACPL